MERLQQADFRATLEFLKGLYAAGGRSEFQSYVLSALPKLVPCEITSYNEVNLLRKGRNVYLAEPQVETVVPGANEFFTRYLSEHPLIAYYHRTRDGHALRISDFLGRREFHRLGLYNELFRLLRVEHQTAVTLPAPPGLVVGIALSRSGQDFSARDCLLLNLLRTHLIHAYQNAEGADQTRSETAFTLHALDASDHAAIVLTSDHRVRLATPRSRTLLSEYFGLVAQQADRLPDELERWVRAETATRAGAEQLYAPRSPLVAEREGKRLVVRLFTDATRTLLLLQEQLTAVSPDALEPLGLTRREADVLAWVIRGKTNPEIAAVLGVRPRTVTKHLEHVYSRLGVRTRTAAATLALEALASGAGAHPS